MKKIVYMFFAIHMTIATMAQEVKFHFTDGIYNMTLKERMEQRVSILLTEINAASKENRNLNLNGVISPEAAARLEKIWENFGFVCQSNAQSICYGLVSGYQARNIQATIVRQPEDCNDPKTRELTVSFDKTGIITREAFACRTIASRYLMERLKCTMQGGVMRF